MKYIICIAALFILSFGCISIPEPQVTVDNVTMELKIDQETCEQVSVAFDLCVIEGHVDPEGFTIPPVIPGAESEEE